MTWDPGSVTQGNGSMVPVMVVKVGPGPQGAQGIGSGSSNGGTKPLPGARSEVQESGSSGVVYGEALWCPGPGD